MFYSFRMPRHPLARLAAAVVGAVVLVALFTVGLFAFAFLVVAGAIWLLARTRWPGDRPALRARAQPAAPEILEGEFTVVEDARRERDRTVS
jgi:membrane protein implicated in regulation of membrane protease activity